MKGVTFNPTPTCCRVIDWLLPKLPPPKKDPETKGTSEPTKKLPAVACEVMTRGRWITLTRASAAMALMAISQF